MTDLEYFAKLMDIVKESLTKKPAKKDKSEPEYCESGYRCRSCPEADLCE